MQGHCALVWIPVKVVDCPHLENTTKHTMLAALTSSKLSLRGLNRKSFPFKLFLWIFKDISCPAKTQKKFLKKSFRFFCPILLLSKPPNFLFSLEKNDEMKMKCKNKGNRTKYFFSIFVVFSSLVFPRNKKNANEKKKLFFFFPQILVKEKDKNRDLKIFFLKEKHIFILS